MTCRSINRLDIHKDTLPNGNKKTRIYTRDKKLKTSETIKTDILCLKMIVVAVAD